jgi:hypothetical protein
VRVSAIAGEGSNAANQLLPLVYEELRKLAAVKLVSGSERQIWNSRTQERNAVGDEHYLPNLPDFQIVPV